MRKATLIVDGNNLLYRNAHALRKLTLMDDYDTPCGGAWGLLANVCAALEMTGADELLIVWDGGRSARRMKLWPAYKGNRDKADPKRAELEATLPAQTDLVNRFARAAGAWIYKAPGVEADDIISLLAAATMQRGRDAIILSNDSDFVQLVAPRGYYTDGEEECLLIQSAGNNKEKVWQAGKVAPELIGEAALITKCLVGDASDNIPGVKGIGAGRANKLREAVLADGEAWRYGTVNRIASGQYRPPTAGDRQIEAALKLLTIESIAVIDRNIELMCLDRAKHEPEVADAAANPEINIGSDEAIEELADELGWKPATFRALCMVYGGSF